MDVKVWMRGSVAREVWVSKHEKEVLEWKWRPSVTTCRCWVVKCGVGCGKCCGKWVWGRLRCRR